jgi:hypothetical protein
VYPAKAAKINAMMMNSTSLGGIEIIEQCPFWFSNGQFATP